MYVWPVRAERAQGATVYSASNWSAIASRFHGSGNYNATNLALVNLALYLRAGYYLSSGGTIPEPAQTLKMSLRAPIKQLADGTQLYAPNATGYTTAER
jgi:microbial collagenase